jgi:hypothetical protein
MPDPFKRCACGRSYTLDQWRRLPICGLGQGLDDAHPISHRHCRCGSTIAVTVDPDANWARDELMAVLRGGPLEHLSDPREEKDL